MRPTPPDSPPAYRSGTTSNQTSPQSQPSCPGGSMEHITLLPHRSTDRRSLRALVGIIGVLIWLPLSLLVFIAFPSVSYDDSPEEIPIPRDVELKHCIPGLNWTTMEDGGVLPDTTLTSQVAIGPGRYSAETSLSLPISSDSELFILSRTDHWGGSVIVKTSTEQAQDSANIHVALHYDSNNIIQRTKACLLRKRGYKESGVGIFGPSYRLDRARREYNSDSSFQITVTLPDLGDSNPLHIKKFETDVPNSRHFLDDLGKTVYFDSISLIGTNGYIEVKSLTAKFAKIETSNAKISGTFNATNSVSLVTSNGSIEVDVTLEHKGTSVSELVAQTSNGALDASINLLPGPRNGGWFDVSTVTSNSDLTVTFPTSPLDTVLDYTAATTNGRATVSLNPAYQGSLKLTTSRSQKVRVNEGSPVDPTGRNRRRFIKYTRFGEGVVNGFVTWDQWSTITGSVSISTSNAPVLLELDSAI